MENEQTNDKKFCITNVEALKNAEKEMYDEFGKDPESQEFFDAVRKFNLITSRCRYFLESIIKTFTN